MQTEDEVAVAEQEERELRAQIAGELWEGKEPVHEEEQLQTEPEDGEQSKEEKGEEQQQPSGDHAALKAMFDDFASNLDRRLKPLEGRVGALQRDIQQQKQAAEQAAKMAQEAPTAQQMADAAQNEEDWKMLKEDFPEWARILDARTDQIRSEFRKEISQFQIPQGGGEDVDAKLQEMRLDYERKLLTVKHPDWRDKVNSAEYKTWLAQQPQAFQAKAQTSTDALECIAILDRYEQGKPKKSATEIKQDREKRLQSSESMQTVANKPVKTKNIDDMSEEEYRRHIAKDIWGK